MNFVGFYGTVSAITHALEADNKPAEALSFLRSQEQIYPPKTDFDKKMVAIIALRCNLHLKRYSEAGKVVAYVMKIYSEQLQKPFAKENYPLLTVYAVTMIMVDKYYLATNQNRNAANVLNSLLSLPQQRLLALYRIDIYSLQYK